MEENIEKNTEKLLSDFGALLLAGDLNKSDSEITNPLLMTPELKNLGKWVDEQILHGNAEGVDEVKKALTAAFISMKQRGCAPAGIPDDPALIALKVDWGVDKIRIMANKDSTSGEILEMLADKATSLLITAVEFLKEKGTDAIATGVSCVLNFFGVDIDQEVIKEVARNALDAAKVWLQKNRKIVSEKIKKAGTWIWGKVKSGWNWLTGKSSEREKERA